MPHDKMRLLTPDEAASTYTFNKHVVKHRFCPVCGMHPYGEGVDPKGNHIVAINVRCLEDRARVAAGAALRWSGAMTIEAV